MAVTTARARERVIVVDRAIWKARNRQWAHLVSDSSFDELHAFAARVGLPPRAFPRDHYDLPSEWHQKAIELGAVEVTSRELVRRLRTAGLRRRKGSELA